MTPAYETASDLFAACGTDETTRRKVMEELADEFVSVARESLDEQALIGADYANTFHGSEDVCALHDYLDANMIMEAAFDRVVRRNVEHHQDTPSVSDFVSGEGPESDTARRIWNGAWDIAKNRGYSVLWERRAEVETEDFKQLSSLLLTRPEHASSDPRFPESVDFEDELHAAADVFLADIRNVPDLPSVAAAARKAIEEENEQAIYDLLYSVVPAHAP